MYLIQTYSSAIQAKDEQQQLCKYKPIYCEIEYII